MDPRLKEPPNPTRDGRFQTRSKQRCRCPRLYAKGSRCLGRNVREGRREEKEAEVTHTTHLQRLKEPFLMCLLIHGHLDMRMLRHLALCQLRTRLDTSQPVITLIFILSVIHMILTSGSVLIMRVASAEQVARLSLPLQEIGQRTPRAGLDVHHAADTRAGLSREETEDGLCASGVESRDG